MHLSGSAASKTDKGGDQEAVRSDRERLLERQMFQEFAHQDCLNWKLPDETDVL